MADHFERMATDWFAEWFPTTNFARADIARLAALLRQVDREAVERCARVVETQYRRESNALTAEDEGWDAAGVRRRVRQRDAAAIRSTLPTPAARGKSEDTEAK